jgi:hypothetical protein
MRRKIFTGMDKKVHETFMKVPNTTMQNKCEENLERGNKVGVKL